MPGSVFSLRFNTIIFSVILSALLAIMTPIPGKCADLRLPPAKHLSLQKEVIHSVTTGYAFLKKHQNENGSWSSPDYPALTGLVVYAFLSGNKYASPSDIPSFIKKSLDFILSNQKENGAIYQEALPNYNTAVCLLALTAANDPRYYPNMVRARNFLISLQMDKGEKGKADYQFDGGIGYGSKHEHSDLSNTMLALESLKMSEFLESEVHADLYQGLKALDKKTLNWDAAIQFISRCQNLPTHNDQAWASDDPKNKGGFVYYPGESKAGEETLPNGKTALRSYGSMTYAGLLSMIYAELKPDDPRVTTAYEWIRRNFTLEENPGLGQQGLYYYYHTLAKALSALKVDLLTTADGKTVDWRKDLLGKLVEKQKGDGSWVNDNGRWWENDPILSTAYTLIAIHMIGV